MRSAFFKFGCLCAFVMLCNVARADQVENPAYKAWSKFGVGSNSTLSMKSEAAGQTQNMQTKMTLSSVADDQVVVESTVTMVVNGSNINTPAQKQNIKKMVDPAAAATPGQPPVIDPKVLANATEETVTVAAGTFKAKMIEMSTTQGAATYKSKIWFSEEVPGGVVKMEMNGDGPVKVSVTGELSAVEKK